MALTGGEVRLERSHDGRVADVTLSHGPYTVITWEMRQLMAERFTEIDRDHDVQVVVIRSDGEHFSSGGDIAGFMEVDPVDFTDLGHNVTAAARSTKPVIVAVDGYCFGVGCELALSCDFRIASEKARFGQPEVKLGIGPGYGGTVRLPRLVGKGRALELLLTGQMIDAQEAYRIGLVNRVVPADRLMRESEQILRSILENGPLAVRACLEAVDTGLDVGVDEALLLEANLFGLLSGTADMREGTTAFAAKRTPAFKGA
jgi:2-oxoglutaroyl-CoA hydrolase